MSWVLVTTTQGSTRHPARRQTAIPPHPENLPSQKRSFNCRQGAMIIVVLQHPPKPSRTMSHRHDANSVEFQTDTQKHLLNIPPSNRVQNPKAPARIISKRTPQTSRITHRATPKIISRTLKEWRRRGEAQVQSDGFFGVAISGLLSIFFG